MKLEKAGTNTTGPDEQILMTQLVDKPPVKSVIIDGKTVDSKFNPVTVPSKFPVAHLKSQFNPVCDGSK